MRTHSLGRLLISLGESMLRGPNIEFNPDKTVLEARPIESSKSSIPIGLTTLLAMSDLGKSEWETFIREYGFPIEIRPRDASRDVLGKLLVFLERNPEARRKVAIAAESPKSNTSPELMKALQTLLRP